jgi:riboflavin kinase / FMN adenylyltransferase
MKIYHNIPDNKNIFKNPVITVGTFDGVHVGHRKILSALLDTATKKSGDPVVITFSSHPRKTLNPGLVLKIITTTEEKTAAIYDFGIPNIILLNFTKQMAQMPAIDFYNDILIKKLDAKSIVIGYDHAFGRNREGNYDFLKQLAERSGIEIFRVEEEDFSSRPVSSSWIREEIESGNIEKANSLLGWRYSVSGTVIRGRGRGRTLGFPTANISPLSLEKIIPADGVYAVNVTLENGTKKIGMLNIGNNPTFSDGARSIEVNIIDFDDIIYNTSITLEFHNRIRKEIKFSSPEQLINQIKQDRIATLGLLGGQNDKR